MKTRQIEVEARDGSGDKVPASLIVCPSCGDRPPRGDLFLLYYVGDCLHLQCSDCGETFCNQTCHTQPTAGLLAREELANAAQNLIDNWERNLTEPINRLAAALANYRQVTADQVWANAPAPGKEEPVTDEERGNGPGKRGHQ